MGICQARRLLACLPGCPAVSLADSVLVSWLTPMPALPLLQGRVEPQMRALEGREAELRTVEVRQQRGAPLEHD